MTRFVGMVKMFQPYRYVEIKNRYYITPNRKSGFWLKLLYNAQLTESILDPSLKSLIHTKNSLHGFPEYKFNWSSLNLIHLPKI